MALHSAIADTLYVCVDPNGGGTGSTGPQTAICSFVYTDDDGGGVRVCGIDAHPTQNSNETEEFVAAHVQKLRECPAFAGNPIVLIIEANLGDEAKGIAQRMANVDNVCVLGGKAGFPGVYTRQGLPERYTAAGRGMCPDDGKIPYHDTVICANPFAADDNDMLGSVVAEFEKQCRLSGDGVQLLNPRPNEDLRHAFYMGLYWSGKYRGDDKPWLIGEPACVHCGRYFSVQETLDAMLKNRRDLVRREILGQSANDSAL